MPASVLDNAATDDPFTERGIQRVAPLLPSER
jgi:hypothetical protein